MKVNVNLIEAYRKENKLTMADLGYAMGFKGAKTYAFKKYGYRNFTLKDIYKLCEIFDLDPDDLIIK